MLPKGEIRVLALNVNGIRQERKRKALCTFLSALRPQPDVRILGETHLLDSEVGQIRYPTYRYGNHRSRGSDVAPARGEVLILVKQGIRFSKETEWPNVQLPLNGRSICVYANCHELLALRITGVYFSQAVEPPESEDKMLTDCRSRGLLEGMEIGQAIGGDFNRPSWQVGYEG